MGNTDAIEALGTIVEALPGAVYRVELDDNGHVLKARISDEMKANRVRVLVGDKVKVEVSICDLSKGLIIDRFK